MRLFIFVFLALSYSALASLTPSSHYDEYISLAAKKWHLDPHLVKAVVAIESNYKKNAVSGVGAQGLMQLMPQTGTEMHTQYSFHSLDNLMGGCRYLRKMIIKYRGDLKLALAAYNAGPEAIDRYKRVPPYRETQNYVKKVLKYYQDIKQRQTQKKPLNPSPENEKTRQKQK